MSAADRIVETDAAGIVFAPVPSAPATMDPQQIVLAIAQIMQDETDADGELSADGEAAVEELTAMLEDVGGAPVIPPARRYSEEPTVFRFDEAKPLEPMPPLQALDYFRRLYPRLGVDPLRFGPEQERSAFTLSVATDTTLLERVQALIAQSLETGDVGTTVDDIDAILDAAGVTERNPGYSEMVWRTNAADAYATGSQRQLTESAEFFPAWLMSNPSDGRSRPTHAARDGKYYSVDVTFQEVRGTDIADVAQCRCVQVPVDRYEWADLLKGGARLESGPPW